MEKKTRLRNVILSFILALFAVCAIGAVEAKAAVTYDPVTDTLKGEATEFVCVLSKDGVKLKAGTALTALSSSGVSLTDLGAKSTKKDVYIYVGTAASIAEDIEAAKATITIKAQAAKKIVGTIDYTQADVTDDSDKGKATVLTATYTDANKTSKAIDSANLLWAEEQAGPYTAAADLTGKTLAGWLEGGKTIYVKMLGDATTRSSAPVKVKIAKQKAAPKIKIDVKKSTIAIKNGFDFGKNVSKEEGTITVDKWYTVLPYNKSAAETGTIFATSMYLPLDKKNEASLKAAAADGSGTVSYTKTKVKALSLTELYDTVGAESIFGMQLAVRKSATNKAPASQVISVGIAGQATAPYVDTQYKYAGDYLILSDEAAATKITVPTLYNGGVFEGVNTSLKRAENDTTEDIAAAKYEYLVVNYDDIENLNWSAISWKTLKTGTKLTVGKTKTSYSVLKDGTASKQTATLNAIAAPSDGWTVFKDDESTKDKNELAEALKGKQVLLVRRAGVKGSTADTSIQASDFAITYFVKDSKNLNWYTTNPIGGEGYKYTIKIMTPNEKGAYEINETLTKTDVIPTNTDKDGKVTAEKLTLELPEGYTRFEDTADSSDNPEASLGDISENKDSYSVTINKDGAVLTLKAINEIKVTIQVYVKNSAGTYELAKDIDGEVPKATVFYAAGGVLYDLTDVNDIIAFGIRSAMTDCYSKASLQINWADTIAQNSESLAITQIPVTGSSVSKYTIIPKEDATIKVCVENKALELESNSVTDIEYTTSTAISDDVKTIDVILSGTALTGIGEADREYFDITQFRDGATDYTSIYLDGFIPVGKNIRIVQKNEALNLYKNAANDFVNGDKTNVYKDKIYKFEEDDTTLTIMLVKGKDATIEVYTGAEGDNAEGTLYCVVNIKNEIDFVAMPEFDDNVDITEYSINSYDVTIYADVTVSKSGIPSEYKDLFGESIPSEDTHTVINMKNFIPAAETTVKQENSVLQYYKDDPNVSGVDETWIKIKDGYGSDPNDMDYAFVAEDCREICITITNGDRTVIYEMNFTINIQEDEETAE